MCEMTEDRSFVARNDAERSRLRSLVARLSDTDFTLTTEEGWTVAAILAHMAFWDQRALALLERWEHDGMGLSPYDADAMNRACLPMWLALAPGDAARLALDSAEAVDSKVAASSPECI